MKQFLTYISLVVFALGSMLVLDRLYIPTTTEYQHRQVAAFAVSHGKVIPPRPFTHDGCTLFPNTAVFAFLQAPCFQHDVAYYFGGSKDERRIADQQLRSDVAQTGWLGQIIAYPMYYSVRLFGDTSLTKLFNAHWGYGWDEGP